MNATVADWFGFAMLVIGAVALVLYIDRLRETLAIVRTQRDQWIEVAEERRKHWMAAVDSAAEWQAMADMRGRGPRFTKSKPSPKRPVEPRDEGLEANVLRDIEDALRGGDDV